jgi:peptidoglycan L-alanyl-D-glutamate endopeptidase CwlK
MMQRYNFGERSLRNLEGIDDGLRRVVHMALSLGVMDFSVIAGLRTQAEQDRIYAQGRTEPGPIVTWTRNSRHILGEAVDIVPYPVDWQDIERFCVLAGVMKSAAAMEGVEIEWGYDLWKKDLPHFQLKKRK